MTFTLQSCHFRNGHLYILMMEDEIKIHISVYF